MEAFRVVKMTVKTGCDLARDVVQSNMPKPKAVKLRDKLEQKNEETFDPQCLVSYLVEPA